MIFIALVAGAAVIIVLRQVGLIEKPLTVFVTAALIVGSIAFIFNNKLHCPFVRKCPFYFCPLHK